MAKVLPQSNIFKCRNNTGSSTSDQYRNNIKKAFDGIVNNIKTNNGFFHSSFGKNLEAVNAVALCPGYLSPDNCLLCVKNSMYQLEQNCPTQKDGVTWVSDCMLRYSDRRILGVLDDWIWVHLSDPKAVLKVADMDKALNTLATRLQGQAVKGNTRQKFAYGNLTFGPGQTLYAAMQCTPDLPALLCAKCLFSAIISVHPCCSGKVSASLLSPNCYLRYDHEKFDKS